MKPLLRITRKFADQRLKVIEFVAIYNMQIDIGKDVFTPEMQKRYDDLYAELKIGQLTRYGIIV